MHKVFLKRDPFRLQTFRRRNPVNRDNVETRLGKNNPNIQDQSEKQTELKTKRSDCPEQAKRIYPSR